jgi:hypothetical protein
MMDTSFPKDQVSTKADQLHFHIDIERCGGCGATLRVIACIETPEVIERILTHLAARNTGCIDYPRAPPLHAPEAQPPASSSPSLS